VLQLPELDVVVLVEVQRNKSIIPTRMVVVVEVGVMMNGSSGRGDKTYECDRPTRIGIERVGNQNNSTSTTMILTTTIATSKSTTKIIIRSCFWPLKRAMEGSTILNNDVDMSSSTNNEAEKEMMGNAIDDDKRITAISKILQTTIVGSMVMKRRTRKWKRARMR
jgi:hypothetical protein